MFVLAGPGKTPVRLVRGRSVELMVKPLLRERRKEAGQERCDRANSVTEAAQTRDDQKP
jgi:hypothetical protein